jgi:hypothetical protein
VLISQATPTVVLLVALTASSYLCVCSRDDILSERRGDVCIDCKVNGVWANAPKDEPA